MSDCLKCSYPRGEAKGERVCKKCGRPENVPKGKWQPMEITHPPGATVSLVDLGDILGDAPVVVPEAAPEPFPTAPSSSDTAPSGSAPSPAPEQPVVAKLPAHSPYGASGAKRWMNCSGSVALVDPITDEAEAEEWTKEGNRAHDLAARCLVGNLDVWELLDEYADLPDVNLVQGYLDYCRKLPGRAYTEFKMHRPELHEMFYGTVDQARVPVFTYDDKVCLRIVDLKWGAGVYVPAEDNEQMKYYAAGFIEGDPGWYPDDGVVEMTIYQPRLGWCDAARSWRTTVGELRRWLHDELLPAMRVRPSDMVLSLGEWCKFCPAKLVCPAMTELFTQFEQWAGEERVGGGSVQELLSDEALGRRYENIARVREYMKALEKEIYARLMDRKAVPGAKLIRGKANRAWKEGIKDEEGNEIDIVALAKTEFGDAAFTAPMFKSPAQIEKLPAGGDAFVKLYAYTPEAGYAVAPESDSRSGVTPKSGAELFSSIDPKLLDAAT